MRKIFRTILTLIIVGVGATCAAAQTAEIGVLTDWAEHGVQFVVPEHLVATEQTADRIVFADADNTLMFECCEADHSDYGCAGTLEIERRLKMRLQKQNADVSRSFAQSRQTDSFRIRTIIAPSVENPHTLIQCACLIGERHTYLVQFSTTHGSVNFVDDILASFAEK